MEGWTEKTRGRPYYTVGYFHLSLSRNIRTLSDHPLDFLVCVFPHCRWFACFQLVFLLAPCGILLCPDWPMWLLWYCKTQSKWTLLLTKMRLLRILIYIFPLQPLLSGINADKTSWASMSMTMKSTAYRFNVIVNLAPFLQAHEAICEYLKVPCVHSDCGELVTRAQLADHLEQRCQYRLDTCEYCHTQVICAVIKVCTVITK